MIHYRVPPEDHDRIVTQYLPDTTGKTCQVSLRDGGVPESEYLPLVGWAIVVRVREEALPRVTFEPVVDDQYRGHIALGDLEDEIGPLTLVDIS